MRIVILGTACVFPTKKRNHTAVLFKYGGESMLFDCGEGTQRQLRIAKQNPMKITKIFISHWHGDHVLGLIGLLQSLSMNQRKEPLSVYGPTGTKNRIGLLLKAYECPLTFKINVHDLAPKNVSVICKTDDYEILATKVKHRISCIAYAFQETPRVKINIDYVRKFGIEKHPLIEKLRRGEDITWKGKKITAKKGTYSIPGKKLAYVIDTSPVDNIVELAQGADIFICEGTFLNEMKEISEEKGHMSAKQAAKLAKKAKVKKLILTHFSQRYVDPKPLLDEAKRVFPATELAHDFMELIIK